MKKSMVLKIGGSVIYDNSLNINKEFLDKLKDWYLRIKDDYLKLVIVVGGGSLSRDLQERIATSIGGEEYLHSIGMSVTHTNANILKAYIQDASIYVPQKLGDAYELLMAEERKTIVCGGLKVGWSTDMDAALFADILGESKIYKISNVDYIYDKDPNLQEDAQPIKDMTWEKYFELFDIQEGSTHTPNNSIPIDISCAIFCKEKGLSLWIAGGKRIAQQPTFEDLLSDGTLVHP
jgi:uridylate kinase